MKLFTAVVALFCTIPVYANWALYGTIENVVPKSHLIFVAEIKETKIIRTKIKDSRIIIGRKINYTITPVETIYGAIPDYEEIGCFYFDNISHVIDRNGTIIRAYGATQDGSGEEFKFKQGDTAVFIFEESNLYNQENNKILRVENITNKDLVLKVLRDMNF